MKHCLKCQAQFASWIKINNQWKNLSSRKFCLTCSPYKEHNTRNLNQPQKDYSANYIHVKNFRKNKKIKAVELSGGKCVVCGYNKCIRNLHFHHVNPIEKSFSISDGGMGRSFETIKNELKKCILVCSNCHGEIHDNLIDANTYFSSTRTRT